LDEFWIASDIEDRLLELGTYGVDGFEGVVFEDFLADFRVNHFFLTSSPQSTRLSIRGVGAVDPVAPQRPHRRSLRSPELQRRPEPQYH
jgi:hypothetical protein